MADEDVLTCVCCHERPAVDGSFCCLVCLPAPEPDEQPEAYQPGLFEVLAA